MYTQEDIDKALAIAVESANEMLGIIIDDHGPESEIARKANEYKSGVIGTVQVLATILPILKAKREAE